MECAQDNEVPLDERKLWIGNLDSRVTEYQLLKLLQIHGTIEKFDIIFHRTGPLAGQPRGYAFVTFQKKEQASAAKSALNGKLLGQKNVRVTWANSQEMDPESQVTKPKPDLKIPALALSKDKIKTDRNSQIQAIEAKLKLMERKEDELKINDSLATKPPVIQQFQFNKDKQCVPSVKPRIFDRHKHKKPYYRRK
ncbi:probable RNA-binding protein 18 [Anthonomus grandis grandis]|uniref:probable RNA-binding protein 18 n=1 Tax=Anthonomus grandis grandis TaxID=2921223 RepID=UPI002164F44F|nr:probable RNA-binding protein 18 [Anthonomus grandis grandis]